MIILLVKPGEKPELAVVDGSLESMQKLVGGSIEMCMPYEDEVALICNDEGKIMGLPLNRSVYDEDGQRIDIMAGTFFVCYAPFESEEFLSLPEDLVFKYANLFDKPETFAFINGKVFSEPVPYTNDSKFLNVSFKTNENEDVFFTNFYSSNNDSHEKEFLGTLVIKKGTEEAMNITETVKKQAAVLAYKAAEKKKEDLDKNKSVDKIIDKAIEKSGENTASNDNIEKEMGN